MKITIGSMWTCLEDLGMVVQVYKHRDAISGKLYPAAVTLFDTGEEVTLLTLSMEDWEPLGRFKLAGRSRFANGVNYRWDVPTLGILVQSIRHDDPLADATPTEKQVAKWRDYVARRNA